MTSRLPAICIGCGAKVELRLAEAGMPTAWVIPGTWINHRCPVRSAS